MCVTILYPVEGKIDLIHFTDRLRSTRESYVLTRVCPSIHPSVCPHLGGGDPGQVQVPHLDTPAKSSRGGGGTLPGVPRLR